MDTPVNIFVKAALISLLSWIYTVFYHVSRKCSIACGVREAVPRMTGCFFYNALLLLTINSRNPLVFSQKRIFVFLLLLIADIDFFCKKIPTELLISYAAVCFRAFLAAPIPVPFAGLLLLVLGSGILYHQKAGIGLYDILFLVLTGSALGNISSFLLLIAEFLILWGITGIFLRKWPLKQPVEKIPLSPLIALAFCFRL